MAGESDPYRGYNFKLEINGVNQGHFTECSGLGIKIEPIKYREAGADLVVHHIPGPVDYAPLVLRYGLSDSSELWDWLMACVAGNVERRDISVLMLDSTGANEVIRWNLFGAWPSEWHGSVLNALSREIAIESLTLVYDWLNREVSAAAAAPAPAPAPEPAKSEGAAPAAGA
jgi:phage tail-like protein